MEEFSNWLGTHCLDSSANSLIELNTVVFSNIKVLCKAYDAKTIGENESQVILNLWKHIHGHNLDAEAEQWLSYGQLLMNDSSIRTSQDFVSALFVPLLTGPDMLLER